MKSDFFNKLKNKPYGLPLMMPGYLGCVNYAIQQEDHREAFRRDTGYDLEALAFRSPLIKEIDKETGYEETIVIAFFDWVTENLWGIEEKK